MNPILYVLYYFFKYLVRITTWVYYAKITVVGERHHRSHDPCILVSNHPSTMLDPLNVAVRVYTEVKFLANAGMFRNPVAAWLLRKLYCIPVERTQDTGGKPLNNAASFREASSFLGKGGCLYIAPEGSSYVERRLRRIKTGTARIAFAAEKANNWTLGLSILPVGLNYSDPTKFRSTLVTIFGQPIRVADFREMHDEDPVNAVHCLTEAIEVGIGKLILDCEDDAQDQLLYRVDAILRNEETLPPIEKLHRSQQVLERLKQWKASSIADYEAFSKQVFSYFERIKLLKIKDLHVKQSEHQPLPNLKMGLLAPFALAGYLSHVLPCFFTKRITDKLNADYHWVPTYKFTAGVVIYPLFIWLQTWLVCKLALHFEFGLWVKWAYLLAYFPLGLIAEWWIRTWRLSQMSNRAAFLRKNEPTIWADVTGLRQQILSQKQIFTD